MTIYLPRTAWTTTPAAGSALAASGLVGVAVHYPGSGNVTFAGASQETVANRLRGWRDFHVNGRGWSDIGYNLAIDQAGRVWMLRSTSWAGNRVGAHSASTSNPQANQHRVGVLLVLGDNETPSAAMIAAFQHWRHTHFLPTWGASKTDLRGHGQVPGASTACPGPRVRALIADGTLARSPVTAPPPPPDTGGPSMSWTGKAKDFVNKSPVTREWQLGRTHQYVHWLRTKLTNAIWSWRGIDYVNEKPSTKNHQLARAHQYSYESLLETRRLKAEFEAFVRASSFTRSSADAVISAAAAVTLPAEPDEPEAEDDALTEEDQ